MCMSGKLIAVLVLVLVVGLGGVTMLDEGLSNAEDGNLSSNQSESASAVFSVGIDVVGLLAIVLVAAIGVGALRVIA